MFNTFVKVRYTKNVIEYTLVIIKRIKAAMELDQHIIGKNIRLARNKKEVVTN